MTTTGNSRPLAACMVIIQTRAMRGAGLLVGFRQQRQLIDEAAKRRLGVPGLVLLGRRHQLHQVLDAASRLFAAILAQVVQVAGLVEHLADA